MIVMIHADRVQEMNNLLKKLSTELNEVDFLAQSIDDDLKSTSNTRHNARHIRRRVTELKEMARELRGLTKGESQ